MTSVTSDTVLFRNGALIDGSGPEPKQECHVLVENDRIKEVSDRPISVSNAVEYDLKGRSLLPGLIDLHAHPTLTDMRLTRLEETPVTYVTAEASVILGRMLDRGFTTIRDAAGADWGLRDAVAKGLIAGPRMFISGRAISQTGGHGDFRRRTDGASPCPCRHALDLISRVADGVDQVRHAVRDELRKGADQIKVMVSGGVASPNDPIDSCEYSKDELQAIVEEAMAWKTYVLAHAYTPEAINHALDCGVRSIEHANLIDSETAGNVAAKAAYVVPTLVTYDALERLGKHSGFTEVMLEKLARVRAAGLRSLEICKAAGVKMGYGTDLLGATHDEQSHEFLIRAEVLESHEVIASATSIAAEILNRKGELGTIAPGALADLIVVNGNPLTDLSLLTKQGRHLAAIMKGGRFHKNDL